jgi:Family of unknown function (DUF6326)
MTAEAKFQPSNVNVRVKISALWASMLFVFAYVDLFSLYRADFRADLEAGKIAGFTINQSFLLGTTVYIVIPSLMVFLALVLRPRVGRIANIALGILYALTIIAGAIGEWDYYIPAVGMPTQFLTVSEFSSLRSARRVLEKALNCSFSSWGSAGLEPATSGLPVRFPQKLHQEKRAFSLVRPRFRCTPSDTQVQRKTRRMLTVC